MQHDVTMPESATVQDARMPASPNSDPHALASSLRSPRLGSLLIGASQAALIAACLFVFLQGWRRNIRVPVQFFIDALFYLMQAKSTIDNGWWWFNPLIGAPFGLDELSFPANGNIDQALVWIVSRFVSDPMAAVNLTWALMIVITGPAATICFRALGASRPSAFVAGTLFALSPYALFKNIGHFGMAIYLVPFVCAVTMQLASGRLPQRGYLRGTGLVLVVGSALLCFNYVYYPFFGCFLLLVGTAVGFLNYRDPRILKAGTGVLAVMLAATVLNLAPSLYSWQRHGRPVILFEKIPAQAEVYALKVRTLVSPSPRHTFPPFRKWLERETRAGFPLESENSSARLGLVGAIGFLGLLGCILAAPRVLKTPQGGIFLGAGQLTIAAVLLAATGAFGSLFNLLVTPEIRAYNRICPFIAFYALGAVALCLDVIFGARRFRLGLASAVLLVVGLWDQSHAARSLNADYPRTSAELVTLKSFVRRLESQLPDRAMVFQLPFRTYLNDSGVARMQPYDHLKLYLVSRSLRWSYPSFSNEQVAWLRAAERLDLDKLPHQLAYEGFSAVVVDRHGYTDNGQAVTGAFGRALKDGGVLAQNDRYIAFDIRPLASSGIVADRLPTQLLPATTGLPICGGQPTHSVDMVARLTTPFPNPLPVKASQSFKVWGWAVDRAATAAAADVDVAVGRQVFPSVYGADRPDVAAHLGNQVYRGSAFVSEIPGGALPRGDHVMTIRVVAADKRCYQEARSVTIRVE